MTARPALWTAAFLLLPLSSLPAARAEDVRDPGKILAKIDVVIKEEVERWCAQKRLSYPPSAVVLRIFKQERELEIWAKNYGQKQLRLVRTLPICAMDFAPGPKAAEGDGKTPEGFYHPEFSYQSSNWWMWMDLGDVDARGKVGKGSSFKMCIEYPNALDRRRTRAAGFRETGGQICMHGNCVSLGCASFKNRDFLPVFAFARHHDAKRYGRLQLHVFPFRFDRVSVEDRTRAAKDWPHAESFGAEKLLGFWKNLEEGFDAFNADPNPLRLRLGDEGFRFR